MTGRRVSAFAGMTESVEMTGATPNLGSWLWVSAGANRVSFMSGLPPLAMSFPWGRAVLFFFPAMVIVLLVCRVFNIYSDTPQGTAIWLPSSVLLTIALLWPFGLIPGGTVFRLFIWGLYGLGGLFAVSLALSSMAWLAERKSKRSKDLK